MEVLKVTPEGEFVWCENCDEIIANSDFTGSESMRHILKALRQLKATQDELEAVKSERDGLKRDFDQFKETTIAQFAAVGKQLATATDKGFNEGIEAAEEAFMNSTALEDVRSNIRALKRKEVNSIEDMTKQSAIRNFPHELYPPTPT